MAPMVDGSDLPFRSFCRQFSRVLCFSPMVSAKALVQYASSKRSLAPMFDTEPGDRPLIFQLSGNDPALVARAALLAQPFCDGVDLNLGCPQYIAQRSRYGAFLMSEPETVERVVRAMAAALTTAMVCVKIRILPNLADTVAFAQMLERAGCQLVRTSWIFFVVLFYYHFLFVSLLCTAGQRNKEEPKSEMQTGTRLLRCEKLWESL